MDRPTAVRAALALLVLLNLTELMLRAASWGGAGLAFDVGPPTGGYGGGFTYSMEYRPVTARWCGRRCAIDLPLEAPPGEARLTLHDARLSATPARVRISAAGRVLAELDVEPSAPDMRAWFDRPRSGTPFENLRRIETPIHWPGGPARLEIAVSDDDPPGFALAIDWLHIEGPRWSVPLRAWPLRAIPVIVLGLLLLAGFDWRGGFAGGLLAAAGAALYVWHDAFAAQHAAAQVAWPVLAFGLLSVGVLHRLEGGRWVVAAVLATYLLKGGGLFHPSQYYPDTLSHARYAMAFTAAKGSIVERGRAAQISAGVGYPRVVAGKSYVMPYSPVFYLPFDGTVTGVDALGVAIKHLALAAAACEVVLVFFLARLLTGPGTGVIAAALAAFLPPLFSRMLLSLFPTIVGHAFDMLVVIAAATFIQRPESWRRLGALAAAAVTAVFVYIASLFNVPVFLAVLALLCRRHALRLLAVAAAATAAVVFILYGPFLATFVREIAPALLAGQAPPTAAVEQGGRVHGFLAAFARVPMFYGYGYPVLAAAGLVLARRRLAPERFGVLAACGLTYVALLLLRGGFSIFKDIKETTFAGPFFAIAAGYALEALAAQGPRGRAAAWACGAGLALFGLYKYAQYLGPAILPVG